MSHHVLCAALLAGLLQVSGGAAVPAARGGASCCMHPTSWLRATCVAHHGKDHTPALVLGLHMSCGSAVHEVCRGALLPAQAVSTQQVTAVQPTCCLLKPKRISSSVGASEAASCCSAACIASYVSLKYCSSLACCSADRYPNFCTA